MLKLILIFIILALIGCGQMGRLYLPDQPPQSEPTHVEKLS